MDHADEYAIIPCNSNFFAEVNINYKDSAY